MAAGTHDEAPNSEASLANTLNDLSLDSYTSLQSLLLFQCLAVYGTHKEAFDKTSSALKQCNLFQDRHDANDERLSPQALRDLYIKLAKDAAKASLARQTSPSKRLKREPSRSPTFEEVSADRSLVPGLIPALWTNYKDRVIRDIRKDEKSYDDLLEAQTIREQEIQKATAGGQTAANAEETAAELQASEAVSKTETVPEVQESDSHAITEEKPLDRGHKAGLSQPEKSQPKPSKPHTSIDSIINHEPPDDTPRPRSNDSAAQQRLQSSPSAQGATSVSVQVPHYRHSPQSPSFARPSPPQPGSSHYSSSEPWHENAYHQQPHVPIAPSQSQRSPVILPPPPGVSRPSAPFPSTNPWTQTHDVSAAQRRPSEPMSPHQTQQPHGQPYHYDQSQMYHTQPHRDQWRTATPAGQAANASRQASHPQQPHSSHPANHVYPPAPPQRGGVMLPPFQVSPQVPGAAHHPQAARQAAAAPPNAPAPPAPATAPQPRIQPKNVPEPSRLRTSEPSAEASPFRTPTSAAAPKGPNSLPDYPRLVRPGITMSPGSCTGWKVFPPGYVPPQASRPSSRSISPVSDVEERTPAPRQRRIGREARRGRPSKIAESEQPLAPARRSRKAAPSALRGRSASTASRGDSVKKEPSTPASTNQAESIASTDDILPPGQTTSTRSTRRSNLTQPIQSNTPAHPPKRRRADTTASDTTVSAGAAKVSMAPPPSSPATAQPTITASRNFGKMCEPIMNVISSHKHASLFAAPVRDRDADGYSGMIRRPQDLKSIRTSIAAGDRAVKAAIAAAESGAQGSPGGISVTGGGTGATVTLPASEAVVPPRGIVNAAQLEQEVMRMFANAVMFNPGDEGVVRDTREMYEAVAQSISHWRGAEVDGEDAGGSVSSVPVADEDNLPAPGSKRRRVEK